jgi:predicted nucleotidyltransferase
MKLILIEWLSKLEKKCEFDILFACEAGSRAWGLSSPHSDFDIRFIYRYHDLKKYLALDRAATVLDVQSPFDCTGYDLFKAFGLMAKSNPGIYEWAYSPIIYKEKSQFSDKLKQVTETIYSPYSLFKHYGSLARRNVNEAVKGHFNLKKQKQLLQSIRAELIRQGMLKTKSVVSPFKLIEIAQTIQPKLFAAYRKISEAKRNNVILPPSEAESMIRLLQLLVKESEEQNEIPKTQPTKDILNEWIWEIFGIS